VIANNDPGQNRQPFGQRHADHIVVNTLPNAPGLRPMAMTPPAAAMPMPMAAPPKARPM